MYSDDENMWNDDGLERNTIEGIEIEIENADELDVLSINTEDINPVFELVRVTKKDFSIYELYRKYRDKVTLFLEVDFQRKSVWNSKQKCELIESVLMGLPLPIFYFKQHEGTKYLVVDGKQRLTTLFDFLNNEFVLKNLKILTFLNDKSFKDLVGDLGIYQSQLEDYQVYSHVILPPTPDKILFDIFDRVNRGGTQLNKQEIRNALYHGKGLDMINEIARSITFFNATKINYMKDERMKGSYLLTRFVSFYLVFNKKIQREGIIYEYSGDVDSLIELTLDYLNKLEMQELMSIRKMILSSLEKAYKTVGEGVFRKEFKKSNPINMNLFETIMYLMSVSEEMKNEKAIRKKILDVIMSDDYLDSIGNSRDNKIKVKTRFEMMLNIKKEISFDNENKN